MRATSTGLRPLSSDAHVCRCSSSPRNTASRVPREHAGRAGDVSRWQKGLVTNSPALPSPLTPPTPPAPPTEAEQLWLFNPASSFTAVLCSHVHLWSLPGLAQRAWGCDGEAGARTRTAASEGRVLGRAGCTGARGGVQGQGRGAGLRCPWQEPRGDPGGSRVWAGTDGFSPQRGFGRGPRRGRVPVNHHHHLKGCREPQSLALCCHSAHNAGRRFGVQKVASG